MRFKLKKWNKDMKPEQRDDIKKKVKYVREQSQDREHTCHWPGCTVQVPPAMWGCKEHWFTLPRGLRLLIWNNYRPGQEKDGKPSQEYLDAAWAVQEWIKKKIEEGKK
jgi:D-alanyl-D-alanine dipeptidase